jgi:hypothetical protein
LGDQDNFATKVEVEELFVDLTNHINEVELTPDPQGERGYPGEREPPGDI